MTDDTRSASGNPLLTEEPLPVFSAIRPEHIEPAVTQTLAEQRAVVDRLQSVAIPDSQWLQKLEMVNEVVHKIWTPIVHLNAVLSSTELREAYNACLPSITEFYTELSQNRALYERFLLLRDSLPADEGVAKQVVRLGIRDFELAGVALEGDARQRYKDIMQGLAGLQASFEQNLMDATDAFSYHEIDGDALRGIPDVVMARAAVAAREKDLQGWLFALDPPTYQAIMSHAQNAALREVFYEAWNTRASDQGPNAGRWDNGPLIEDIVALRKEAAELVGFDTFAQQSIASKMAGSPQEVIDFLRDLARRSRDLAKQELADLRQAAGRELQPWDIAFYAERHKQQTLDLFEEELRPFFPIEPVLAGLFELAAKLFDVRVLAEERSGRWHETVRYYRLEHADGAPLGGLFADLFARPNKRGGAWMDACVNYSAIGDSRQLPVAHLVCNFNPPVKDSPALLTHSDVVTLFHEFGHSLHHLLTEVSHPSLAGINGVAWDAVELPSQFLENYAFSPEVLTEISRHCKSGEQLPEDKIRTLKRSRIFLAGLATLRQLEFALFDFLLHDRQDAVTAGSVRDLLDEVRSEIAVIQPPPYNRFANGFAHIFAGGYAAGYYSYKWAEVLAADAFAAFEETNEFDTHTARRFRDSILAVGGSHDAIDAFMQFRGRAPDLEPLLRQSGIPMDDAAVA